MVRHWEWNKTEEWSDWRDRQGMGNEASTLGSRGMGNEASTLGSEAQGWFPSLLDCKTARRTPPVRPAQHQQQSEHSLRGISRLPAVSNSHNGPEPPPRAGIPPPPLSPYRCASPAVL